MENNLQNYNYNFYKVFDDNVVPSIKPLPRLKDSEVIIMVGTAASGKSTGVAYTIILKLLTEPGQRILYLYKIGTRVEDTIWKVINDIIAETPQLQAILKINKNTHTITVADPKHECHGNYIVCSGAKNVQTLKSMGGKTGITTIILEEANNFTKDDYDILDTRLRTSTDNENIKPQIILMLNPEYSWINKTLLKYINYEELKEKKILQVNLKSDTGYTKKITYIYSSFRDNPFLSQESKKRIETITDEKRKAIYRDGDFWIPGGTILWQYAKIGKTLPLEEYDYLTIGADFGYGGKGTTAVLLVGIKYGNKDGQKNQIHIIKEYYRTVGAQIYRDMIPRIEKVIPETRTTMIIGDSANPNIINEFKQEGFNIKPVRKVKQYQQMAITFLQNSEITISPNCTNTIIELQEYSWATDETGEPLPEGIPDKSKSDHAIDALYYSLMIPILQEHTTKKSRFANYQGIYAKY